MSKFILWCGLCVLFYSCATTNIISEKKRPYASYDIPYALKEIRIIEGRDSTYLTREDIKLPFFSSPGQEITIYPALAEVYKEIIRRAVQRGFNSTDDSGAAVVFVTILQAEKMFSATWKAETERARVVVNMSLISPSGRMDAIGSADLYVRSIDAKNKRFEEIFQKAFSEAIEQATQQLKLYTDDLEWK